MIRLFALAAALCLGVAACAAPSANHAPSPDTPVAKAPTMSGPLPATEVREAPKLDTSCKVDADCVVKNVGNCCGAMPVCVNKDSPVDAAAVQSQCARDGRMSACGFKQVTQCRCAAGKCIGYAAPVKGWIEDPAPQPDPVR